jgi:Holliday junction DNA helicase RuvA
MIGRLTGLATPLTPTALIVNVGGVGYKVSVPAHVAASVNSTAAATFFIHTHVREDALELFGFPTTNELSLFELLLSVSGIGPKTALLVVDRGVEAVVKAVLDGDVEFFTTIPRLGKKNAQKIIIELKNKLGSTRDLDLSAEADSETRQLMDALLSMGFVRSEIADVITRVEPAYKTMEQKIRRALQLMGNAS